MRRLRSNCNDKDRPMEAKFRLDPNKPCKKTTGIFELWWSLWVSLVEKSIWDNCTADEASKVVVVDGVDAVVEGWVAEGVVVMDDTYRADDDDNDDDKKYLHPAQCLELECIARRVR